MQGQELPMVPWTLPRHPCTPIHCGRDNNYVCNGFALVIVEVQRLICTFVKGWAAKQKLRFT